jgi:guanylate kinase
MLLILCGPSGVGKTTLAHRILDTFPAFQFSVSCTTRPPRPNETPGVDYHFVDGETFAAMVDRGEFAEHARVHSNRYGTTVQTIDEARAAGRSLVFDIDWQGAEQLLARYPNATSVMVAPPGWDALAARLRGRATDSEAVIAERLRVARFELSHFRSFRYLLVNDDLESTWNALQAICQAGRHETHAAADLLTTWNLLDSSDRPA